MPRTLFGREPALWIAAIVSVLAVLGGFAVPGVDDGLIAGVTAFLTAAAGVWTAFATRPVAPAIFTGLITTGATLGAAFGLDLSQAQVGSITAAVAAIMTVLIRGQITPARDPVDSVAHPVAFQVRPGLWGSGRTHWV